MLINFVLGQWSLQGQHIIRLEWDHMSRKFRKREGCSHVRAVSDQWSFETNGKQSRMGRYSFLARGLTKDDSKAASSCPLSGDNPELSLGSAEEGK